METIWNGHLIETFYGYKSCRVYRLSNGSEWQQEDRTDEPVYREHPSARLIYRHDIGATYLDVEGTSAIVRVVECGSRPKPHAGAF